MQSESPRTIAERRRPWVLAMRWHDLLFAHWPLPPEILRRAVPAPLELDTRDGEAWLGIVPFAMSGVRLRGFPPLPGLSRFPELNVRTYVRHGDRRAVYFFSLDAKNALAVRIARLAFSLAYYRARMQCRKDGAGWIHYQSQRCDRGSPAAELVARYRPCGPAAPAASGSLAHFLTERRNFLTVDRRGVVRRGDIAHPPWQLQPAELEIERCAMTEQIGVALPDRPPLLHYATDLEVRAWLPTPQ